MMGMGGGGMGGGGMDPMGNMNPMATGRLNMPGTGGNMGMDMHRIPIVGNMFQNPYDMFKQQQMQNAAASYSMYRPEAAQAWTNAQNQQSAALQPMNNAIASMYGSGATQGFQAQNPFGATAFQRGAAVGTDPSMPTPGSGGPPQNPASTGSDNLHGAGDTALDLLGQVPGFFAGSAGPFGQGVAGGLGGMAQGVGGGFGTASSGLGGAAGQYWDAIQAPFQGGWGGGGGQGGGANWNPFGGGGGGWW